MPINNPVIFRNSYFDQPAVARATRTLAGIGQVGRAMAGAQQPLTAVIKDAVGLPVQFHRHVRATVQVSMRGALKANRKSPAGLARIVDIERHGLPAIDQVNAVAKGQQCVH